MINHIQYLLNSYRDALGEELIERKSPEADYFTINEANFVVVSHGIEDDPVLNYGNQVALNLWELSFEDFTKTPSHKTAESVNRAMRQEMLNEVMTNDFFANYHGVRISSTGNRFEIQGGIIWNVRDEHGNRIGQAATFKSWEFL